MLVSLTIRCDWPGCRATLTYDFRLLRPDPVTSWKAETDNVYSCHLCPTHKRKRWEEIKRTIHTQKTP